MLGRKTRDHVDKARKRLSNAFLKLPHIRKNKQNPEQDIEPQASTTPPGSPMVMTALRVSVTARFESPIDKNFYESYEVSPGFEDSDQISDALLRRIDHCAHELITRPDPKASQPLNAEPRTKLARYHLIFRVDRKGLPWKERHFTSFQEQPMTPDAAHEVVLEADRIITLFLHWHDPDFEWKLPSVATEDPLQHKSVGHEVGIPQSIHCIPTYSGHPGYSIDLILRTHSKGHNRSWGATLDSKQATPLTLHLGENLMSQVKSILHQAVNEREERFDEVHEHCNALEGTFGCRHFDEGAFDLVAKIRNNYGPDYPHLAIRFQTFRRLVGEGHGVAFMQNLRMKLGAARDVSDNLIDSTDDLVIKIHELRSRDWKIAQPLTVTMDSSVLNCRKATERILERVESRMTDVLRGHGTVAALTAHKRGHLVLETTICLGDDNDFYDLKLFDSLHLKKRTLQKRLRDRIQEDIRMVMKDTISLDNPRTGPNLKIVAPADLPTEPLHADAKASQEQMVSPGRRLVENSPLFNPRHRSVEEGEASKPKSGANPTDDYGYMADVVSEKSDSLDIRTPSLTDTASINLQDGAKTPPSARAASPNFDSSPLDIMDFEDSHHDEIETTQEHAGTSSKASSGTVVRRAQPPGRTATKILASYWEPTSSHTSGVEKSGTTAVSDLRQDPNIWFPRTEHREAFSTKEGTSPDLTTEGSWFANKFPMAQDPPKTTAGESMRRPLSMASGNSASGENKGKGVLYKSNQDLNSASMERPSAMGYWNTADIETKMDKASKDANVKSTSTQVDTPRKNQPLILDEPGNPIRFFPRRAPAQVAPEHTHAQAEGLFHRRRVSSPTGSHIGLHGEWSIETGLRNALVPLHLRGDQSEQRSQSHPGRPSAWPKQFQKNLER